MASVLLAGACGADDQATNDFDEPSVLEKQEQAVIGGSTATTAQHPEVGRLMSQNLFLCSAVLVGRREFVTAAHCIGNQAETTSNLLTFRLGTGSFAIERIRSLGHDNNGNGTTTDLAIGRLVAAVPETIAQPARLASRLPNGGTNVTLVGWGCDNDATNSNTNTKRFRSYPYTIVGVGAGCGGDSGGGLFIGGINDGGALIGVHSGSNATTDVSVNIPLYKDRIEQWIRNFETVEPGIDRPGSDLRNVVLQGGATACQNECNRDPACRAFTFVPAEARCWIKGAVPDAIPNFTVTSGLPQHFLPFGLTGSQLSSFTTTNREMCEAVCASSASCTGWQFSGTTCKTFTGTVTPVTASSTSSGMRRAIERNTNRWGEDYSSSTQPSSWHCMNQCAGQFACRAWSFVKSTGACFLKGSISEPSANTDCESGIRRGLEVDVTHTGTQISTTAAADPYSCDIGCRLNSSCQSWSLSFASGTAVCSLKNSIPSGVASPGTVSGYLGLSLM